MIFSTETNFSAYLSHEKQRKHLNELHNDTVFRFFDSAQSLNSFPGKAIINSPNCSSAKQLSMACHVQKGVFL